MPDKVLIVFTDIDECASAPCQNGGTCTDQVNGYLCQCASGYSGLQCQKGKFVSPLHVNNILFTEFLLLKELRAIFFRLVLFLLWAVHLNILVGSFQVC